MIDSLLVGISILPNGHARLLIEPASPAHDPTIEELLLLLEIPSRKLLLRMIGGIDKETDYPSSPRRLHSYGQVIFLEGVPIGHQQSNWHPSHWWVDGRSIDKALAASGIG